MPNIATAVVLGPVPGISEQQKGPATLFGPTSASATSPIFDVTDLPIVIKAFNITSGETVQLWAAWTGGTSQLNQQVFLNSQPVTLTVNNTMAVVNVPGRYYCVIDSGTGLGSIVVTQEPTAMSNLTGLMT